MQPQTSSAGTKPAAPIVDVMAPPKPVSAPTAVVEAPQEEVSTEAITETPAASKVAKPEKVQTKHTVKQGGPTVVIVIAAVFFIILSSLAYYAYTKNV